ncbi:MAG: GNAT family N-acetyltransferase [Ferruginibacter sp.]
MDNNTTQYQIVKGNGNDAELEKYRLTFENNESPRKIENLIWLHQKNIPGTNSIFYAMNGDDVAAIYTALPVKFHLNGQKSNALQSIDTITDINHRGKGLFPKLAKQLYADATNEGFSLVYGFPNENSAPGFFNKLGWTSFGEAPFIIKPLSISYFFKKILNRKAVPDSTEENYRIDLPGRKQLSGGDYIESFPSFTPDYDDLWNKISTNIKVCVDRGMSYMNWRYVEKPDSSYTRLGYYRNGILQGVIVFTIKNKHQGRVAYIMELIYDGADGKIGKALLKYAHKICRTNRTDVILAWAFENSFNFKAYKKTGYYHLPIKLRPQHLFLGVKSLAGNNQDLINNINNWYISYSDSDTV